MQRSREESVATVFKRPCPETGAAALPASGAVPPLWSLSLGTAIGTLATGDVGKLADALLDDPPLRAALQERLLRRARHIGDLADDDLMEVAVSSCNDGRVFQSCATLRVKTLPFRVRAAAKLFFREACAAPEDTPPSAAVCRFAADGRLEFDISELDFYEHEGGVKTEWTKKYLEVVEGVARDTGVPTRDGAGFMPVEIVRSVKLRHHWPHLQKDTLEHDAYDLVINDRAWGLGFELDDDISTYFFEDCEPTTSVHVGKHYEQRDAVWVRKPRIRFVVTHRGEFTRESLGDPEAGGESEEEGGAEDAWEGPV